jgi:5-methylcytosine-specific restriction endonuclease McrA
MTRLLLTFLLLALPIASDAAERSPRWPAVRRAYLADHPTCEACGSRRELQVHHVFPFAQWPERELDRGNLITLCDDCHLEVGHWGNYRTMNPCVREHAAYWLDQKRTKKGAK